MATYVFAGGGTGGHIYPALAIREHLLTLDSEARTLFLCSKRPIDSTILVGEQVDFEIIPAEPFMVSPARMLRFVTAWPAAVGKARSILESCRSRGAVVVAAMGGFVAAPIVQAARRLRLPVVLVNLDSVPGKANRIIARDAQQILDAGRSGALKGAREIRPIVRRSTLRTKSADECRAALGLDPALPTLFVTGGSQGATSINAMFRWLLANGASLFGGWQVFHQSGAADEAVLQRAYDDAGVSARVVALCRDMGAAWGAAELAVSRCGAGAVAEVWANAVPTVFLPYPHHKDQHQRLNALPLERSGAAIILDELPSTEQSASALRPILESLMKNEGRRQSLRASLHSLGPADGAESAALALHAIGREAEARGNS